MSFEYLHYLSLSDYSIGLTIYNGLKFGYDKLKTALINPISSLFQRAISAANPATIQRKWDATKKLEIEHKKTEDYRLYLDCRNQILDTIKTHLGLTIPHVDELNPIFNNIVHCNKIRDEDYKFLINLRKEIEESKPKSEEEYTLVRALINLRFFEKNRDLAGILTVLTNLFCIAQRASQKKDIKIPDMIYIKLNELLDLCEKYHLTIDPKTKTTIKELSWLGRLENCLYNCIQRIGVRTENHPDPALEAVRQREGAESQLQKGGAYKLLVEFDKYGQEIYQIRPIPLLGHSYTGDASFADQLKQDIKLLNSQLSIANGKYLHTLKTKKKDAILISLRERNKISSNLKDIKNRLQAHESRMALSQQQMALSQQQKGRTYKLFVKFDENSQEIYQIRPIPFLGHSKKDASFSVQLKQDIELLESQLGIANGKYLRTLKTTNEDAILISVRERNKLSRDLEGAKNRLQAHESRMEFLTQGSIKGNLLTRPDQPSIATTPPKPPLHIDTGHTQSSKETTPTAKLSTPTPPVTTPLNSTPPVTTPFKSSDQTTPINPQTPSMKIDESENHSPSMKIDIGTEDHPYQKLPSGSLT